jgi:hypothetical protein
MTGLEKFEKFNHKISMSIEWVGLVAIVLMMLITTIDVLGTKLFLLPVFGALDIMMLAQLVAMTFAPSGHYRQHHIFTGVCPFCADRLAAFLIQL